MASLITNVTDGMAGDQVTSRINSTIAHANIDRLLLTIRNNDTAIANAVVRSITTNAQIAGRFLTGVELYDVDAAYSAGVWTVPRNGTYRIDWTNWKTQPYYYGSNPSLQKVAQNRDIGLGIELNGVTWALLHPHEGWKINGTGNHGIGAWTPVMNRSCLVRLTAATTIKFGIWNMFINATPSAAASLAASYYPHANDINNKAYIDVFAVEEED